MRKYKQGKIVMRSKPVWSALFATALGLSLFGFQLIGAFADAIGMETPRPLSLALRFGGGFILTLLLFKVCWSVGNKASRFAFNMGVMFILFYGLHLIFKTLYNEFPLRLLWYEYLGYLLFFVFIPFLASAFAFSKENFEYLFRILLTLTAIVMVLYLSMFSVDTVRNLRFIPFKSVNPIGVGYAGLTAATLAAWVVFVRRLQNVFRLPFIIILFGGVALAIASGQRQVFLSLVITTFLFIYLMPGTTNVKALLRRIAFLCVIGVVVLTVIQSDRFDYSLIRIERSANTLQYRSELRVQVWQEAVQIFFDNPVFGGPVELPSIQYYPHNLVIEAFMVTGVVGGFLFVGFYLYIIYLALRLLSSSEFGWISLFHYQVAISALLSGSLYAAGWYWISSGLIISAYNVRRKLTKNSRTRLVLQRVEE